jgi:IS30 family transposase
LRDRGLGVREIARRLGRSASTVSRELRRHLRPHDRGIYDGDLAHAHGHSAERLRIAILPVLTDLPSQARQTLTWDQGSEMACHHLLEEYFADGIFFAPPASPWLRGTNENTNGLLRQYFPKGSDLRAYTLEDLRAVEQRINGRPRKRHAWRSPARLMEAELAG